MRSISEVVSQALVWVQPSLFQRTYELQASDDVVARLQLEGRSFATGETAWQKWTFERAGFWRPRVTIQIRDSGKTVVPKPAFGGASLLDLANGRQVRFGAANFWRSRWRWSDTVSEAPIMEFKVNQGGMRMGGRLEIEMAMLDDPELPLLAVLGWYLLVLRERGAAVAAVR